MKKYEDLGDYDEDYRIDKIGRAAMDKKARVVFVTDDDPGKADRYIRKLTENFPGIRIISRGSGPVPNCVYVTVGPPSN